MQAANGGSESAPAAQGAEGASPITQVLQLSAPAAAPPPPPPLPPPRPPPARRGLVGALLRCCGRLPDEAAEPAAAPPARTVYIPPAPHVGAPFIPALLEGDTGKKTLVLDLDETLVHSSFKPVPNPDYVIPVEIDGKVGESAADTYGCARGTRRLGRRARSGLLLGRAASDPAALLRHGRAAALTRSPAPLRLRCVRQITDVYVLKRPWVDHFLVRARRSRSSSARGAPPRACLTRPPLLPQRTGGGWRAL
jgi:hypothetical protein